MSERPTPTMEPRLRATLHAKAAQFGSTTKTSFDPDRVPEPDDRGLGLGLSPVPGRAARARLIAAAAAVVAVLTGVAVVALRQAGDTDATRPGAPHANPTAGDGTLAPTWIPGGLHLYGFDWQAAVARDGGGTVQLFGRDGGTTQGAIYVSVQPTTEDHPGGPDSTTVRGSTAEVAPARDFARTTTTLTWVEGNAEVAASFTGMSRAAAVAFLDGLSWRSGDHLAGFAPPTGADLTLLGEVTPSTPFGPAKRLQLDYLGADHRYVAGVGAQLSVRTAGDGPAGVTRDYLQTWFHGSVRAGGMVESYDPRTGILRRDWRDGRSVAVDGGRLDPGTGDNPEGSDFGQAALTRVADGVAATTGANLVRLRHGAEKRFGALSPFKTAHVDAGTLELRADTTVFSLCFTPDGGARRCSTAFGPTMLGSFLMGDTWYVAVATEGGSAKVMSNGRPLDGQQHAAGGGMNFVVVAVPAGIDDLEVTGDQTMTPLERPPF
jgi:hypothetical protein